MRFRLILALGIIFFTVQSYAQRPVTKTTTVQDTGVRRQIPRDTLKMIVKPIESLPSVISNLIAFQQIVTRENYRSMGFETPDEIHDAKIEPPIQDFQVRLDQLKRYQPGKQPDYLLMSTGQMIFPLSVNGQIKSSMTLRHSWGYWRALSYGNPDLTKQLTATISLSSQQLRIPVSEYLAIRIPALNIIAAGYRSGGILYIVPLINDRKLRYRAGESLTAEDFFTIILPDAVTHDGSPR